MSPRICWWIGKLVTQESWGLVPVWVWRPKNQESWYFSFSPKASMNLYRCKSKLQVYSLRWNDLIVPHNQFCSCCFVVPGWKFVQKETEEYLSALFFHHSSKDIVLIFHKISKSKAVILFYISVLAVIFLSTWGSTTCILSTHLFLHTVHVYLGTNLL